ncbi:MAG: hypothetical protein ACK5M7_02205 [Draconibacterium sp.]
MNKAILKITFISLLVLGISWQGIAQQYKLTISITNQPDNPVVLGWVEGDVYTKTDSARTINGQVQFSLPDDKAPAILRLDFGLTPYARIMKEDPQQLDLIFNKEDIDVALDFKDPVNSLKVVHSEENKTWYDFLKRQNEYDYALGLMEKEVDLLWQKNDSAKAIQTSNEYNRLQMDWDSRVEQTARQNAGTFAAKLISLKRKPMSDAFLSKKERTIALQKTYLDDVDFSDETLIHSSAYTDKIFDYLVLFNHPDLTPEQRSVAYIKAVDIILSKTAQNPTVNSFIKKYLIHGFEVLDMKDVLAHIKSK